MKALVIGATGLMRSWTPMPTKDVAAAMVRLAKSGKTGHGIITSQEIRIFAYSK